MCSLSGVSLYQVSRGVIKQPPVTSQCYPFILYGVTCFLSQLPIKHVTDSCLQITLCCQSRSNTPVTQDSLFSTFSFNKASLLLIFIHLNVYLHQIWYCGIAVYVSTPFSDYHKANNHFNVSCWSLWDVLSRVLWYKLLSFISADSVAWLNFTVHTRPGLVCHQPRTHSYIFHKCEHQFVSNFQSVVLWKHLRQGERTKAVW